MMRPILPAMARDFWIKGRWLVASGLSVLLLVIVLGRTITVGDASTIAFIGFPIFVLNTLYSGVFLIALAVSGITGKRWGFPSHLYALPVATRQMVGIQMLIAFVTLTLVCLIEFCFFRWVFGLWPPIIEPCAFLIAAEACALMVVWSLPDFVFLRLLVGALIASVLVWWVEHRFGVPSSPDWIDQQLIFGTLPWAPTSWTVVVSFLLVTLAAWLLAVAGVERDRRGGALGTTWFHRCGRRLRDRVPEHRRPFPSPQMAQFWAEWNIKGWLLPCCMVLSFLVLSGCLLFGWDKQDYLEALMGLVFVLLPLAGAPVIPLFIGPSLSNSLGTLGDFRATRPLSDQALAHAVLKVGASSVLLTWIIGVVALFGAMDIMTLLGLGPVVSEAVASLSKLFGYIDLPWFSVPLLALGSLIAAWGVFGLLSAFGLAGQRLGLKIGSIALIVICLVVFLTQVTVSSEVNKAMLQAESVFLGLALPVGAAWAFIAARRRNLIGPWLSTTAIVFSVALLAGVIGILLANQWFPFALGQRATQIACSALGGAAVPLAPLALGPLAVRWNRHR